ncbi:MAG: transcriptional regulator [Phycisphaerales bacterium]|nr:transcriptional regulator [Phycisphaerales bacterium]
MEEQNLDAHLGEILDKLPELAPDARAKIERLSQEVRTRHERMRKTLGDLQDSLDHLRLSVKYLVFDLEATRRENQYLRRLIEAQGGRPDEVEGD